MATAKEVKLILEQTTDGVETVKLVNENVKAVDERVKIMADGKQSLFIKSPTSSLILIIQTASQLPRKWGRSFNKRPTE